VRGRPTIGILCFNLPEEKSPGVPRCGQNHTYIRGVIQAGGLPVLMPQIEEKELLRALFDRIDGLLLPGGVDLHPALYGEEVLPACGRIDATRDAVELSLARWALEEQKPVLAICRGIQVLNVALGGSLYQDIASQLPSARRHDWHGDHRRDRLSHGVAVASGTKLRSIVGQSAIEVNSLHHQAAKTIASGLRVSATAPDGIVEGLEATDHPFALGVQWHPEELTDEQPSARALFEGFVQAARVEGHG
jgi:putative glutamine amidotransferase